LVIVVAVIKPSISATENLDDIGQIQG